jgi:hypothetical protein
MQVKAGLSRANTPGFGARLDRFPNLPLYVAVSGLVSSTGSAVNIRGAQGAPGLVGSNGEVAWSSGGSQEWIDIIGPPPPLSFDPTQ